MSIRRSMLQKVMEYFRTVDVDEARVARTLVDEIVDGRMEQAASIGLRTAAKGPTKVRRTRRKHAGEPAEHTAPVDAGQPEAVTQ